MNVAVPRPDTHVSHVRDRSWSPQPGPQDDLCCCPLPEVFFGGARGGGKTDGVLGKWALKERRYGSAFNAIMFRRTSVSAEDAIERSKEIYTPLGGRYIENKGWRMPNGGRVTFKYLEKSEDAKEYQGRNVTDAWVEEAGQYASPGPIDLLFGVLRSAHGVPVQLILTANPGGAGQHWLRDRYHLHPFPRQPKVLRRKLPNGDEHRIAVIPSRITDNRILLQSDPGYVSRLYLVGSAQLVKAWLEGDWTAIEGAFFAEWSEQQHVIAPFAIPGHWLRFRSGDWGSYSPFSIGWWAVVGDDYDLAKVGQSGIGIGIGDKHSRSFLPRGALIRYREWYGTVGGKLTAEQVGKGIATRERDDRAKLTYGVLDPSAFSEDGGPSIAERINDELLKARLSAFTRADNSRVARQTGEKDKAGPMGGWDQVRSRLVGTAKRLDDGAIDWSTGRPALFAFSTCKDFIRTFPVLQHDQNRAEDLDTDAEDHCFTPDTIVRTSKGLYNIADLVGNDGVIWSDDGLQHHFRSARLTRVNAPIVAVRFSDGSEVRCTPDHRFLTINGWVQARYLSSCFLKRFKSSAVSASTSAANTFSAKVSGCIASFMRSVRDRFQKAITSITTIRTSRTISPETFSAFPGSIISRCTDSIDRKSFANLLNASDILPRNGMAAQREKTGIESIIGATWPTNYTPRSISNADTAATPLRLERVASSAQTRANQRGAATLASMMRRGLAMCVASSFRPTSTPKSRRARESAASLPVPERGLECVSVKDAGRSDVYCITVHDTGNFVLANGAIVSNCADETRYACLSRPWIKSLPKDDVVKRDAYREARDERYSDSTATL